MNSRIAIIGSRGYPSFYGGFETAVRELAPFLAGQGWEVTVYGRAGNLHRPEAADQRVRSVVTRGLDSKSLSTLTYGLTATIHAMIHKPDVALVLNVANGFWLPLLRMRGIPTVVNVDGIEWERAKWGRLAKRVFRAGAWMTAHFGDELVADAQEIGRRWKAAFSRESTFIPYGGHVPPQLKVSPGLVHRGYALVVARFVPENTVEEFFRAVEDIGESYPVVIVGSSGYGSDLDERAKDLAERFSSVHWLGHVSDDTQLLSLWQHAGVYFHGHSVGGTNPALVQAVACGSPVVARDTPYNREVLGPAGLFVIPEYAAIKSALDAVMFSDVQELDESIRSRILETYSWSSVCQSYADLFTKVASKPARRSRRQRT